MAQEFAETVKPVFQSFSISRIRRARDIRRVFLFLLVAFVALGSINYFGVNAATVSAENGGYVLIVHYGSVSRLGLATPWDVVVRKQGGFDGPVTLATTASYFEIFDENGLDPQPSSSTIQDNTLVWEFEPPEGRTLKISFDARIEPTFHGGRSAITSVRVDGTNMVAVRYRTKVWP